MRNSFVVRASECRQGLSIHVRVYILILSFFFSVKLMPVWNNFVVQESAGELAPGPQTSVDLESEVDSIMAG